MSEVANSEEANSEPWNDGFWRRPPEFTTLQPACSAYHREMSLWRPTAVVASSYAGLNKLQEPRFAVHS